MIIVHHLNNSRSQRVLWLLEELGIPYEVKRYERDAKTMLAPPELRAIHPLGKSPVISDAGKTIAETGTIVEYLIETYGGGRFIPAAGTDERLRYNYWMHYSEGSAMPLLVMKLIFSRLPKASQMPRLLRPIAEMITGGFSKFYIDPQIQDHLALWEAELAKSACFAGPEITGADIMMIFPTEAAGAEATLPPRVSAWQKVIYTRPAYQAALERGGPYELMG